MRIPVRKGKKYKKMYEIIALERRWNVFEERCRKGLNRRFDRGWIARTTIITDPLKVTLGRYSNVSQFAIVSGYVDIGDYCIIGPHAFLWSRNHNIRPEGLICIQGILGREKRKIIIGNDVWIGSMAFISDTIRIGDHAVIGAGAVVTKNVPPWEIWAGVPARKIGDRRTWFKKMSKRRRKRKKTRKA